MTNSVSKIDTLVRTTLCAFSGEIFNDNCLVERENEAINLYVFGYLVRACKADGILRDLTQIAIDAPVKPIAKEKQIELGVRYKGKKPGEQKDTKSDVGKDLVIWPRPRMTCWENGVASKPPSAILEWKFNIKKENDIKYDIAWLKEFSSELDAFVGYSVSIEKDRLKTEPKRELKCTRVYKGEARDWLSCSFSEGKMALNLTR